MSVHPYETAVMMRRNQAAGFDSIGAVATQKVDSTRLNLGFPSAYESVLVNHPGRIPQQIRIAEHRPASFWAGNDLQSDIHQQRKQDADHMARQKVLSTQRSRVRFVGTPHGRGFQPEAKLGQRIFANQSNGAYFTVSGRRDGKNSPWSIVETIQHIGGGLSGGVLRSPEGVAFGRKVLGDRIRQLNNIQVEKQSFMGEPGLAQPTGAFAPAEATTSIPTVSESAAIELNVLLEGLINNLIAGSSGAEALTRFTFSDATRAVLLIFRMVPTAPPDFTEDLMGKVDTIIRLLEGALETNQEGESNKDIEGKETALSLKILFDKLREYLVRMIEGAPANRSETQFNPLTGRNEQVQVLSQEQGQNLSPRERLALSKALVQNLGFSKMLKTESARAKLRDEYEGGDMLPEEEQRYREGDMDDDQSDDDDRFDRPGRPREDEAHSRETGVRRGDRGGFDEDERNPFGRQEGADGIAPRYFDAAPQPLGYAEPEEEEERFPFSSSSSSSFSAAPQPEFVVRGRFDPDTQGFNVDLRPPPSFVPSRAQRVRVAADIPPPPPRSRIPRPPASTASSDITSASSRGRFFPPVQRPPAPRSNDPFPGQHPRVRPSPASTDSSSSSSSSSSARPAPKPFSGVPKAHSAALTMGERARAIIDKIGIPDGRDKRIGEKEKDARLQRIHDQLAAARIIPPNPSKITEVGFTSFKKHLKRKLDNIGVYY